ncbi:MAG: zinc ribbon domain-containing protein [Planctomycetes bacterium]|nr:zinc ribbon domain-containing protein [Planctomycetota bacterium]
MIIWGSCGKEKVVGQEDFFCPRCRSEAVGDHVRVSRYFTLYFIPLFPISTVGEYIRCDECEGTFEMDVLDLTQEDIEKALAPWRCQQCGNNNPSDYSSCLACKQPRANSIFLEDDE